MCKTFFAAVKAVFGDHVQVIDRFHVVQQAVSALDEVLRSVQEGVSELLICYPSWVSEQNRTTSMIASNDDYASAALSLLPRD